MDLSTSFKMFCGMQALKGTLLSLFLLIGTACIYVGVNTFDWAHPLLWFREIPSFIVSWSFFKWVFVIETCLSLTALASLKVLLNSRGRFSTRFEALKSIFLFSKFLKTVAFIIFGTLLPLMYRSFSNYSLYQNCSWRSELPCVNSGSSFVLFCGIWTGLYYFICKELFPKQVRFPIIIRTKRAEIRSKVVAAFYRSARRSIAPVLYFVGIFYMTSSAIFTILSWRIFCGANCQLDSKDESFWFLPNLYNILQAWFLSTIVYFSMWGSSKCTKIFITMVHPIPLSELLISLKHENSFQQLHAFYKLYLMSVGRYGNITDAFALAEGTPKTWKAIYNESLRVIRELQIDIGVASGNEVDVKAPPPYEQPEPQLNRSIHLRRLTSLGFAHTHETKTDEPLFSVAAILQTMGNVLMTWAPVRYIFAASPEDQLAVILEGSQSAIWALESLAILTGRAINEDRCGVVVNDIPQIVMSFLSVRAALEKAKLAGPGKQRNRDRSGRMKTALLSAVNRGLFRIAITYSDYLDQLHLPPEAVKTLKAYIA